MSSSVKENKISLTRGDTLRIRVSMKKNDERYIPSSGDKLRFAFKSETLTSDESDYKDREPLILKDIPIDTLILSLDPKDTKNLPFGKYVYDIELTLADGSVDTIITASPFTITKEVY